MTWKVLYATGYRTLRYAWSKDGWLHLQTITVLDSQPQPEVKEFALTPDEVERLPKTYNPTLR